MNNRLAEILVPLVNSKYGAPMGRADCAGYTDKQGQFWGLELLDNARPLYLVKIILNHGGYDQGGAYWGHSAGTDLYGYTCGSNDIKGYVRAATREQAKALIREDHEHARFFR